MALIYEKAENILPLVMNGRWESMKTKAIGEVYCNITDYFGNKVEDKTITATYTLKALLDKDLFQLAEEYFNFLRESIGEKPFFIRVHPEFTINLDEPNELLRFYTRLFFVKKAGED